MITTLGETSYHVNTVNPGTKLYISLPLIDGEQDEFGFTFSQCTLWDETLHFPSPDRRRTRRVWVYV